MLSDSCRTRAAALDPERPVHTRRVAGPARTMLVGLALAVGACVGPVATVQAAVPGVISTVAGDGTRGYQGEGVPAISGELSNPNAVAATPDGGLLIADSPGNVVRFVAGASCSSDCPFGLPSIIEGDIYTIAGDGVSGHRGDFGPATHAELDSPQAVAVDGAGDLLIADALNHRIRLVARSNCGSDCPYGLDSMRGGYIYTVAGNGITGDDGTADSPSVRSSGSPTGLRSTATTTWLSPTSSTPASAWWPA